jgi:hypothetical protein
LPDKNNVIFVRQTLIFGLRFLDYNPHFPVLTPQLFLSSLRRMETREGSSTSGGWFRLFTALEEFAAKDAGKSRNS